MLYEVITLILHIIVFLFPITIWAQDDPNLKDQQEKTQIQQITTQQTLNSGNKVFITQTGSHNTAEVNQKGNKNTTTITHLGNNNNSTVSYNFV